jgi:PAS domain S-box-containing protein
VFKGSIRRRALLVGLVLVVAYWLIEAVADFLFGEGLISYRLFPADPNEIWMRLVIVSLILAFTGYVGTSIEERARFRRRLRMFQSAIYQTEDAIVVTTPELDPPGPEIVYVNEAFCRLYGYTGQEILGQSPRLLHKGDSSERKAVDHIIGCLEREQRFEGVVTNYRKDGSPLRVEVRITPVYNSSGELVHWLSVQRDITERERTQETLRQSEKRYRLLVETAEDYAIFMIDPEGRIAEWNSGAERIFGYTEGEIVDEDGAILFTPEDRERNAPERELERAQTQGRAENERWHIRKDGARFWGSGYVRPMLDEEQNPRGFVKVMRDITERKTTEEALRQSEERYRLLVETAEDYAMCMVEPDGRVANWNSGAERIFGYREEEIVGKDYSVVFPPEDVRSNIPEQERKRALAEGRAEHEGWRVRKDGSRFWASGIMTPVRDDAGNLRGFSKVVRDITERRQAEEALERAEEKYRSIFENAAEGIFQTTVDGRILTANPAAARILGYESPEELMANISDVRRELYVDPEDRAQFTRLIHEQGKVSDLEVRVYRKDGSVIWVSMNSRSMRDEGGDIVGYEGTLEDVTERKRAEQALQEQREYLRQVIDTNPSLIFVKDWDGRFTLVNKATADIYGATVEELVGKTDADFNSDQEQVEAFLRADREVMKGLETKLIPEEAVTDARTGEVRWFQTIKVPLEPSGDGSRRVLGVSTDITERKESERRLQDAEKRYRTLVEQVPAVIYTQELSEPYSTKARPTMYASPQIEAQVGYPPQAFIEDPDLWSKLLHPDDRERVLAEDARTDGTGEPFKIEYRLSTRDGREVWVRDEAILMRDENGRPLYWQGIQQDITERKRAEEALREVRQAERREIARELHDEVLQELMDALYSMQVTRLKLRDADIDIPEMDREIDDLRKANDNLRAAINNLRKESIHQQPFIHLLRSVVVANRQKAPHIDIDLDVDVSVPLESTGRAGIELLRIIQEALVNVRRHSWAQYVRVRLREEDEHLVAEVVDDGRGFDSETTWGGVGLSAMHERVFKLNGELEVHSEPGKGTRVMARVPTESVIAAMRSGSPFGELGIN